MKNPVLWRAVWSIQKVILIISYGLHGLSRRRSRTVTWEVGVTEISSMVTHLAAVIPDARSSVLYANRFYRRDYVRAVPAFSSRRLANAWALLAGPWWLGATMHSARGVFYVGQLGYLVSSVDDRRWEMGFARRNGLAVACFLTGTDIRSTAMSEQLELERGSIHVGGILGRAHSWMATPEYETAKRRMANAIDSEADLVFSMEFAQASYLKPGYEPTLYAYPDEEFVANFEKFDSPATLRILHAPSSPLIKGTAEVRQAIARLRAEGFVFEYIELTSTDNEMVTAELSRAHIVLNNFFSYTPGVFGVEALARGCVMLTSASETLEPGLPRGCDTAWIRTGSSEIHSTLAELLERPAALRLQAERGFNFARENFSATAARHQLLPALDRVLANKMKP